MIMRLPRTLLRVGKFGAAACLLIALSARGETLLVSAAASLATAFKEIGTVFGQQRPGVKVDFTFAASDVLLRQIVEGAPVDVYASADQLAMDSAAKQNAVDAATRVDFAGNRLVLALPSASKLTLTALEDLKRPAVARIAVGQPATVPVGRYAKAALSEASLWPVIEGKLIFTQSTRQSLDYLSRGEVDAGFVYATDAALMQDKVRVAFEVSTRQPVVYPIAVTARSKQAKLAGEFVALVLSEHGQGILRRFGFTRP